MIRGIQDTRKAAGFDVSDRISLSLTFVEDADAQAVAQAFDIAGVASETLAEAVVLAGPAGRLVERGPWPPRSSRTCSPPRPTRTSAPSRSPSHGSEPRMSDRTRADAVYSALLERQGEQWVQPRVERTRRVLELLADPQRTYRVIHVTGRTARPRPAA